MALISIILPCFNAQSWIDDALQSVQAQKLGDIEVIVVDDGSTDKSAALIADKYPSIKLIKTEHRGPSHARNLGTNESCGEFIQYLDADDLLAPDKLQMQLQALKFSQADIAYGKWQRFVKTPEGNMVKGELIEERISNPEIDLFLSEIWAPPAAFLFRRTIIEKIGGWNEAMPLAEDARLLFECALHQAKFVYCDQIMAYYRVHKSLSVSNPKLFAQCCLKNIRDGEAYWQTRGGIDLPRKTALITAYAYLMQLSYGSNEQVFKESAQALKKLSPRYLPKISWRLRKLSRITGFKHAVIIGYWLRQVRRLIRKDNVKHI